MWWWECGHASPVGSLEREGMYLVQVTELVLLCLRQIPAVLSSFGLISYFFMSTFPGCIDCAAMRGSVKGALKNRVGKALLDLLHLIFIIRGFDIMYLQLQMQKYVP